MRTVLSQSLIEGEPFLVSGCGCAETVTLGNLRMILGVGQEREVRVNADHADVAKFRNPGDPTYSAIKEILLSLVKDIEEESTHPFG